MVAMFPPTSRWLKYSYAGPGRSSALPSQSTLENRNSLPRFRSSKQFSIQRNTSMLCVRNPQSKKPPHTSRLATHTPLPNPSRTINLPNPSLLDQLLQIFDQRRLSCLQPNNSFLHAPLILQLQQFLRFSQALAKRPLNIDILARLQTRTYRRQMSINPH